MLATSSGLSRRGAGARTSGCAAICVVPVCNVGSTFSVCVCLRLLVVASRQVLVLGASRNFSQPTLINCETLPVCPLTQRVVTCTSARDVYLWQSQIGIALLAKLELTVLKGMMYYFAANVLSVAIPGKIVSIGHLKKKKTHSNIALVLCVGVSIMHWYYISHTSSKDTQGNGIIGFDSKAALCIKHCCTFIVWRKCWKVHVFFSSTFAFDDNRGN